MSRQNKALALAQGLYAVKGNSMCNDAQVKGKLHMALDQTKQYRLKLSIKYNGLTTVIYDGLSDEVYSVGVVGQVKELNNYFSTREDVKYYGELTEANALPGETLPKGNFLGDLIDLLPHVVNTTLAMTNAGLLPASEFDLANYNGNNPVGPYSTHVAGDDAFFFLMNDNPAPSSFRFQELVKKALEAVGVKLISLERVYPSPDNKSPIFRITAKLD